MSGDIMQRLAAARPGHLDPDVAVDEKVRRTELSVAMANASEPRHSPPRRRGSRTAPGARRIARPIWGLGLVGAAAAAALVVATTATGPGDSSPDGDAPNGPGAAAVGEHPQDARTILLAAAQRAARAPDTSGAFWHVKVIHEIPVRVGPRARPYVMLESRISETWTTRAGKGWFGYRSGGARPKTPADAAAWRADGSPAKWDLGPGDTPQREHLFLRMGPGPGFVGKTDPPHRFFVAERNMTYAGLRRLPADPEGIRAWAARAVADSANSDGPVPAEAREGMVAQSLASLLVEVPVSAKVRAAAYRALAEMPIVRSLGPVKDERGRNGVGLAIEQGLKSARTTTHMVIDPATSFVLSERVASWASAPAVSAPAKEKTSVYLAVGWTDSRPQVPSAR